MTTNEIDYLKNQLAIARNEISNLRAKLSSLGYSVKQDIDKVNSTIKEFKCENCKTQETSSDSSKSSELPKDSIVFKSIGTIKTIFSEKRAVPRQANVGDQILSRIELNPDIYTNPSHSLEGLEEFSHFWIIYHFHKNEGHSKAKVTPPRLNGEKVGVFSTRSPHRPNSIGISLVQLDHIENSTIFFYGTDMVNGTPLLDIKPYIPHYDSPASSQNNSFDCPPREEPDGQETDNVAGSSNKVPQRNSTPVRVPDWITNKNELTVIFNETATEQLQELGLEKEPIVQVLKSDPRSIYLKTKYGSQIYTFQIQTVNVTCKFDDKMRSVTVLHLRKTVINS